MNKNTCIVFISKNPTYNLINLVEEINQFLPCYIISARPCKEKHVISIDKRKMYHLFDIEYFLHKDSIFDELECPPTRLEVSKSLLATVHIEDIRKFQNAFFIEDDVYIKKTSELIQLVSDYSLNDADYISCNDIIIPSKGWLNRWEPHISENTVFKNRTLFSFSPMFRCSKSLIDKTYQSYLDYDMIYFHEAWLPSICIRDRLKMDIIPEHRYNMHFKSKFEELKMDGKSFSFIHPIKGI